MNYTECQTMMFNYNVQLYVPTNLDLKQSRLMTCSFHVSV